MSGRGRFLAAGAAGVVGALAFVLPASAGQGGITSPSEHDTVSQPVAITGSVTLSGSVDSLSMTVSDSNGGQHSAVITTNCSSPATGFSCSGSGGGAQTITFQWTPNLPFNGSYAVQGQAVHNGSGPFDRGDSQPLGPVHFGLAVPPRRPTNVSAFADQTSRAVTVSWSRNTEPDLTGYYVLRTDQSGTTKTFAVPAAGPSQSTLHYTDTDVSSGPGGSYSYAVQAERQGVDASQPVRSTASSPAAVTVAAPPPPPTTSTTSPPGTDGQPAGASTPTTAAGGSSSTSSAKPTFTPRGGSIDASAFQRFQAPPEIPPPPPPDPGFDQTLPYGPAPTSTTEAAPTRTESAIRAQVVTGTTTDNRRTLLSFLAGALVLFTLSMHLRWLLRSAAEPGSLG